MKELYRKLLNDVQTEHQSNLENPLSRILIIDGLNTFIRSWTTTPNMNETGDHVGGITGFLKSIAYVIREVSPTKVIIVFDGKGGSDKRKKLYEGYKSDRGKNRFRVNRTYPEMMNEEDEHQSMKRQFGWLMDYLNILPLTTLVYDGIEADDVIAYISNQSIDSECIIMSTDKDFLQLVDDRVSIYSPTKKIYYNIPTLEKEFGLFHKNFLLYRILNGDSSDNVPGVKGCGLVTLLKRFPELATDELSIDGLYGLCEERKGKYKLYSDILNSKELIDMNQKLMSLKEIDMVKTYQKLDILNAIREPITPLNKFEFIQMSIQYKMETSWNKDIHLWLRESFGGLR
jgi:DNA polymerase I